MTKQNKKRPEESLVKQVIRFQKRRDINRILCAHQAVKVLAEGTSYQYLIQQFPNVPNFEGKFLIFYKFFLLFNFFLYY